MSIYAMQLVRKSGLAKTLNTIAMEYADRADDEGRGIYPSISRIAYDTGYDERTVQRATAELKKRGVLRLVGIHPVYKTNEYVMVLDALPPKHETFEEYKERKGGDKMSGVTLSAPGGDTVSPKPLVIRQDNPPTPQGGSEAVADAPEEKSSEVDPNQSAFEEALIYFYAAAGLPLPPKRKRRGAVTRWRTDQDLDPMAAIARLAGGDLEKVKEIIDSGIDYNLRRGRHAGRKGEIYPVASPRSIMVTAQRFATNRDESPAAAAWDAVEAIIRDPRLGTAGVIGEWSRRQPKRVKAAIMALGGERWLKTYPNRNDFIAAWDAAGGAAA